MKLIKDQAGVNFMLEYIFTFMIASLIFSLMLVMVSDMFIDSPSKITSKVQYTDLGNDITAKIVDTYLVAPTLPDNGNVSTGFDIPYTIGGKDYEVDVQPSSNTVDKWDKEVMVKSDAGDVTIVVTLNGVNSTTSVSGNTRSNSAGHRIWYSLTGS